MDQRARLIVFVDGSMFDFEKKSPGWARIQSVGDGSIVKTAAGVGLAPTGTGIWQVVQSGCAGWVTAGITNGLSHILRPETEQKTERQKTFAYNMSFTAGGA